MLWLQIFGDMHVYMLSSFNYNELFNFYYNEVASICDIFLTYKYWVYKTKFHYFQHDVKLLA